MAIGGRYSPCQVRFGSLVNFSNLRTKKQRPLPSPAQGLIANLHADGAGEPCLSICAARELVHGIGRVISGNLQRFCGAVCHTGAAPRAEIVEGAGRGLHVGLSEQAGEPDPWPKLLRDQQAVPTDLSHAGESATCLYEIRASKKRGSVGATAGRGRER